MKTADIYLYQFACPVLILMGLSGCIINLLVFTQKTLRKSPCSNYFIAYNLANSLYICASLLSLCLNLGYSIDPSSHNLVICRLRLYIIISSNIISPSYLILASVDRILVTSPNARTRQRSTHRLAYICIVGATLFWALFHIHALILTNIIQIGPNTFLCYYQLGVYLSVLGYYAIIIEILALSLMTACGLWSIKNVRSLRRVMPAETLSVSRTVSGGGGPHSTSSKDRQLISMLVMDITVYASFSFLYAIFLMYQQVTQNYIKSVDRVQTETIVRNICLFGAGIPFCTSCYTNLMMSKTFRKEVKNVLSLKCIFRIG